MAADGPKRKRQQSAGVEKMRAAIARGVPRNKAINDAVEHGVRFQAIANALELTRQTIYRIVVLQGASERELKARAAMRRKRIENEQRAALKKMAASIKRGVPRDAAILETYRRGVPPSLIGEALDITRQRVHQIIAMYE